MSTVLNAARRILIGTPLPTAALIHERFTKLQALAVLSSDALSSVAYATEEILLVLVLAGAAALHYSVPVALAIVTLLAIVVTSYRQTIRAYPQGGGSYIVAKDNLGTFPALVAASSLLVGYILTVAVSIASGVLAIASAFPALQGYRVIIGISFVAFMTVVNLRGIRETARVFAAPTYVFVASMLVLIAVGIVRIALGLPPAAEVAPQQPPPIAEPIAAFLLLRAFASGCSALTGTEAIADGVPAFKPPEAKNAATTLAWMGIILGIFFLGTTYLANQFGIVPVANETVISQIARAVFGPNWAYFLIQAATAMILILAANTAFSDFPRLSYFLARDRFMPTQFANRGDRLAFSTGIVVLGGVASALIVIFDGSVHALIPLYAIGVFVAFTVSQSSMVKRWRTRREKGWERSWVINAIGAFTTGVVSLIFVATKLLEGAWISILLIAGLVFVFTSVNRHYGRVAARLALTDGDEELPKTLKHVAVVPVPDLNRAVLRSLAYARTITTSIAAVHVTDDPMEAQALKEKWGKFASDIPLVILESPYRATVRPLLAYVDAVDRQDPQAMVTVILTELIPEHWWEHFLHNQTALRLRARLHFRPNTAVVSLPYHMEEVDQRSGQADL